MWQGTLSEGFGLVWLRHRTLGPRKPSERIIADWSQVDNSYRRQFLRSIPIGPDPFA
jgi:hypothetical protein